MTGTSIRIIMIIPIIPTEPRKSSTPAASVPRVEDTVPPDRGTKLLTANFTPRIAAVSAFDDSMLCEARAVVSIIITKASAVVYHFLTVLPSVEPTAALCPSNTDITLKHRQIQNTGMTVYEQINWHTVSITPRDAVLLAAAVTLPPIAYSAAESGKNDDTA